MPKKWPKERRNEPDRGATATRGEVRSCTDRNAESVSQETNFDLRTLLLARQFRSVLKQQSGWARELTGMTSFS